MFARSSREATKWACGRFLVPSNKYSLACAVTRQSPPSGCWGSIQITRSNNWFCLSFVKGIIVMARRNFKGHSQTVGPARLKVLLDLDQVLADFEGYFLQRYKERFPDLPFIEEKDRNTFYLRDQYAKLRSDLPDRVREIYMEEYFFLSLPEIQGSIAAAKAMADMEDVDVFICTSPLTSYRYCLSEKFQWVEDHLGADWVDRTIIAKDKTMIYGHILIDDRPHIKGACKNPSWEHIVFTSHHNIRTDLRGKRRLDSWTDGHWKDLIEDFKKRI
ncbi:5'(3')-deoxyribonucleotidase, cytosolic type-like [Haliotis rubra]|uniref:5'(3')-deoxyribonucleotidase, cytosolic type-like n=1 Tax=Haliotis rubra TaxID=36100 RepID=UPI001EE5C218|nr:5'(3')-deoxyribonucleotidase, cytosolic type-like [Haliotis rubra]